MIRISHRGNLQKAQSERENTVAYIQEALNKDYHVEIDVFFMDNKWFLGHDGPETEVEFEFLDNPRFFLHCKNLAALNELTHEGVEADFFAHDNDKWVLTRNGFIWTFPRQETCYNSIIVDLENSGNYGDITGVCSDIWEK